jgi:hypothetical protein
MTNRLLFPSSFNLAQCTNVASGKFYPQERRSMEEANKCLSAIMKIV